ncbi:MAG: non-homologous end-joining DNA ligase, partial [Pseudomonadota bacterium]
MSIKRYNEKRNFKDTPEPAGKTEKSSAKALLFVIQKHEASHLHYDFRLELEGVMKSWAVPKGPSLNPEEKRLAMHVEDHPMSYRTFEGIIPKGNYGAGTVMVWDEGTYYADAKLDKKANEKLLIDGYRKGKLSFYMKGKKLHGEFSLVRMRGKNTEDNAWLLLKADDANADRDSDVRDQDKSAVSGRAMTEIAASKKAKIWISNKTTKSVASGKTTGTKKKAADGAKKTPSTTRKRNATSFAKTALELGGKKSPVPKISGPQLATLIDEPFDREGWAFEIKWDGYRALGYQPAHEGISLISRNGHSFDERFPVIRNALATLPCDAIIDGEIVALDEEGKSSFGQLQKSEENNANLVYYLFDLLYVAGVDVRALPLRYRKQLLQQLLEGCDERLQYSDHVETSGVDFFEAAKKGGLEGILAKDLEATYQTGSRTRHWLKIKLEQRQEFIIAGYTQPRRSRSDIGSLVLGYYGTEGKTAGKLRFAGHVGSGMDTAMRAELKQKLDKRALKKSPFAEHVPTNEPATWVKPELVCEVRYTEKTTDCQLRHPVFIGLRTDKAAHDIHWDVAQDSDVAIITAEQTETAAGKAAGRKQTVTRKQAAKAAGRSVGSKTTAVVAQATNATSKRKTAKVGSGKEALKKVSTSSVKATSTKTSKSKTTVASKPSTDNSKPSRPHAKVVAKKKASAVPQQIFAKEPPERDKLTLKINNKSVAISNPKRIYFPELKISKMEVIDYYRAISDYLLPYLKDRPFVLHRFPSGIYHEGFYQKDNEQELPGWIKTVEVHSESTNEEINYIVCQNEATLVYLANLGCLEMNPWNSRVRHLDKPDWMIFDLDPVDISFAKVVEVAQVIHGMFDSSGVPHYCKTSGKRGLHIAVPLGAKYTNNTVREMAEAIAQLVHQELPGSTSLERSPAKRQKKIYLDYLQNGHGKTLVAPYSLRPVDYAGVSTPLHWDEVTAKLDPRDFTIHTIM